MNDPRTQYDIAVDLANDALANYKAEPKAENFRIWRDSSEVAIKWCRAMRLNSSTEAPSDDDFAKLLAG